MHEEYRVVGFKVGVLNSRVFYDYKILKVGIEDGRVLFITNLGPEEDDYDPLHPSLCRGFDDETDHIKEYYEDVLNMKEVSFTKYSEAVKHALSKPVVYNEGDE